MKVVRIIQLAFTEGVLPEEITWAIMVLLPKGKGEYQYILLAEETWKLCTLVLNARMKKGVDLYDSLHEFWEGRETGTVTLEATLDQKLTVLDHEPLFQVFLDARKAYEYLERERCMDILKGYRLVLNMARLLRNYREKQKIFLKEGKFTGRPFVTGRGFTQGDP